MSDVMVVLTRAPLSGTRARDAIDAAITAAVFGHAVTLALMADGVHTTLSGHGLADAGLRDVHAALSGLDLYDVKNVIASHECLQERGLRPSGSAIAIEPRARLSERIAKATHVLTF